MLDFNTITELSRTHCLAICAVLVPVNMIATLQTLIFTGLRRSSFPVKLVASVASFYALIMVFHVITWWLVGVVMAPTYILLGLGSVCLVLNSWAIIHAASMADLIQSLVSSVGVKLRKIQNFNRAFFPAEF